MEIRPLTPQPTPIRRGDMDCLSWSPATAIYDEARDRFAPRAEWRADVNPTDCGAAGIAQWCPLGSPGDLTHFGRIRTVAVKKNESSEWCWFVEFGE